MRPGKLALTAVGIILTLALVIWRPWNPRQESAEEEAGPRAYRFAMDYTAADVRGHVTHRQHVEATCTRGRPGGDVVWNDVSVAEADGASAPLGEPRARAFMEGFRYRRSPTTMDEMFAPGFFENAPPTAIIERNLVWDVEALDMFAQALDHLEPNEPYRLLSSQTVRMPGIGTFHNRDVQLILTGRSQRNGQDCAVIDYRAYFNPLSIANGGMTLVGRSHYWGQIWVALATGQIEYATLFEDVLGEMQLPGQDRQVVDVFRNGVLEPRARR
ncbi:MAG TPA: hypothetical protein VKB80_36765 [Kofleriaceae bacterium]|nr:hypothetical protein [Kofleriaceae bacterium]